MKGRVTLCLLCREVDAEACRERRLTQIMVLFGIWALTLQPSEAPGKEGRQELS